MLELGKLDIAARLLRSAEVRGADPGTVVELAASIDAERGPVDSSPWANPRRVCGLLRRFGLDSRGWRTDELGGGCASEYLEIGPPGPRGLPTNAAYYVEGSSTRLTRRHSATVCGWSPTPPR